MQVLADHAAVTLLGGIILEQVSQHLGAGKIVDGDHFIAFRAEHLTERKTADSAETVDSNFNRHDKIPPFFWTRLSGAP